MTPKFCSLELAFSFEFTEINTYLENSIYYVY